VYTRRDPVDAYNIVLYRMAFNPRRTLRLENNSFDLLGVHSTRSPVYIKKKNVRVIIITDIITTITIIIIIIITSITLTRYAFTTPVIRSCENRKKLTIDPI
jgi:hypothetical protein